MLCKQWRNLQQRKASVDFADRPYPEKGGTMAAWLEYRFDFIDQSASASIQIYGYANNEVVAYSWVVYALSGQAYYPLALAKMTVDDVTRYSDESVARDITVQNLANGNPCTVDIDIMSESF
jgi:hypothetical protein